MRNGGRRLGLGDDGCAGAVAVYLAGTGAQVGHGSGGVVAGGYLDAAVAEDGGEGFGGGASGIGGRAEKSCGSEKVVFGGLDGSAVGFGGQGRVNGWIEEWAGRRCNSGKGWVLWRSHGFNTRRSPLTCGGKSGGIGKAGSLASGR